MKLRTLDHFRKHRYAMATKFVAGGVSGAMGIDGLGLAVILVGERRVADLGEERQHPGARPYGHCRGRRAGTGGSGGGKVAFTED